MVADLLGVEPDPRSAGQQPVLRIGRELLRMDLRRPLERLARHDHPHEPPRVPAAVAVLRGQPIEEFGMARRLTLEAEVFARLDEPRTEQLLPEPVGRQPGRERLLGRHEPPG